MHFTYHIPTKVVFGCGSLQSLATEKLPGKKALIVITNGKSMKNLGYFDKVVELLKQNKISAVLFDKVLPNPVDYHVMEAAEFARNENCDFIIGLGGGSAIDTAKSIAIMVNNKGTYWDYVKGNRKASEDILPIVAIPTTAGTGTEVDPWTVITNPNSNEKIGFGIPELFPTIAIVDPELMLSVPQKLTAYQGMDAFFHSTEGYLANVAQPASDIFALDAIRRINEYLPQAVQNGNDIKSREQLAWASTEAGMVESTSCCISEHSMEHALSAFYPNLPHGAGLVALSVPYYSYLLQKDRDSVAKRYCDIAKAMGKKGNNPEEFIDALKELINSIGLKDLKLSDWGVKKEEAEILAVNSFEAMGALYELDPVRLTKNDAACIIRAAIY